MDNPAPYQSLFKSWNKRRPKDDEPVVPQDTNNPDESWKQRFAKGDKAVPGGFSAPEESVQKIRQSQSSSTQIKKLPQFTSTQILKQPLQSSSTHEKLSESPSAQILPRSTSARILFDFSAPSPQPENSFSLEPPRPQSKETIRAKLIHEFLDMENDPMPTMITFRVNENENVIVQDYGFEAFIRNVEGTSTNDLIDVIESECQTQDAETVSKWTQKPIRLTKFEKGEKPDPWLLEFETIGVGPDPIPPLDNGTWEAKNTHSVQLDETSRMLNFVRKATKTMLSNLNDNIADSIFASNPRVDGSKILDFARGDASSSLNQLAMHTLHCEGNHVACANIPPNERNMKGGKSEVKNIVTVWSIYDPSFPVFFLRVWGEVSKIKMIFPSDVLICGTNYGGINVFDLREDEMFHKPFLQNVVVRTASFHSGSTEGTPNHVTRILGLEAMYESEYSTQIISLDNENTIICWGCARILPGEKVEASPNSVIWSRLRIGVRHILNLGDMFSTSNMITNCLYVWESDHKYFLVGTGNGFLGRAKILPPEINNNCEKFYVKNTNSLIPIHYMDVNANLNLYIAAHGDKRLSLFEASRSQTAILTIACEDIPMQVLWSRRRFSMFYVAFADKIAIWDLITSDIEPVKSYSVNNLQEFQLQFSKTGECLMMISNGGMKLQLLVPANAITALSTTDEKSFRHYVSVTR